jgi:hypothetical protein
MSFRELIPRGRRSPRTCATIASSIVMGDAFPQWEKAPRSARRFVRYGASPRAPRRWCSAPRCGPSRRGALQRERRGHQGHRRARAPPSSIHLNFEGEAEGIDNRQPSSRGSWKHRDGGPPRAGIPYSYAERVRMLRLIPLGSTGSSGAFATGESVGAGRVLRHATSVLGCGRAGDRRLLRPARGSGGAAPWIAGAARGRGRLRGHHVRAGSAASGTGTRARVADARVRLDDRASATTLEWAHRADRRGWSIRSWADTIARRASPPR